MNDIKSLLDSIINNTQSDNIGDDTVDINNSKECFREKVSLNILKDIITVMMDNQPVDDSMIDQSILRHVKDDYKGTCFGYISDARDRLNSPILGSVIQEINKGCSALEESYNEKKCIKESDVSDDAAKQISEKIKEGVPNYKALLEEINSVATNQLVNDVTNGIKKMYDKPVFDNIDKKISIPDDDSLDIDMAANESAIIRMTGAIVNESFNNDQPMSADQGMEKAICEYCVEQMMFLFKDFGSMGPYQRYLS